MPVPRPFPDVCSLPQGEGTKYPIALRAKFVPTKSDWAQRYLEQQLRQERLLLPHGERTEALALPLSSRDEEGIDLSVPRWLSGSEHK